MSSVSFFILMTAAFLGFLVFCGFVMFARFYRKVEQGTAMIVNTLRAAPGLHF